LFEPKKRCTFFSRSFQNSHFSDKFNSCIPFFFLIFSDRDAGRPKLKLLPRTAKEPINALAETSQAAAIFGKARPREEKAAEEGGVDEQQQQQPPTVES
jgi:hypothetical protein